MPNADVNELRAAAEREPESVSAHLKLGTALAQRNQVEEAEQALQRALALDPKCAGAWVNLGGIRLTTFDFQGCVEANQRAAECDPSLVLAHYNCGLAHLYLNQPDEMLACFERVIEIEPEHGAGHYHAAVALLALGRVADAQEHLSTATNLGHSPDPRFVKAMQKATGSTGENSGGDEAAVNLVSITKPKPKN